MGLQCKQASEVGVDWGQTFLEASSLEPQRSRPVKRKVQPQQQPQPQQLKCPRCASTNTKFCYYNNYNKSQPRHFCKSCKRHWTKGGTLRNVPVGGCRRNKRLKTSPAAETSGSCEIKQTNDTLVATIQDTKQQQCFPSQLGADRNSMYQLLRPPSSIQCDFFDGRNLCSSITEILKSRFPFSCQDQSLHHQFQSSSSFDSKASPISSPFRSATTYNCTAGPEVGGEDLTVSNLMPPEGGNLPWKLPTSSGLVEGSNWNLDDDIDAFVSADLNLQWDNCEGSNHETTAF